MAGYSKIYVVGGLGGYMGSDGVNPIDFLILVGDADRQWLESHYFDKSIKPIGKLRIIVPTKPNDHDSILDACIAFAPQYFESCPSLRSIKLALKETHRLDFNANPEKIPGDWSRLRGEARPIFRNLNIWVADLVKA